jgi:predicted dehydrogenase
MKDRKKIRFIIAGFGFMGQTHCGTMLADPQAELAGIVDPFPPAERISSIKGNQNTVTITADDVKNIPHYTTLSDALKETSPDAVVVALPTRFHCQAVMECLEAGTHVFVEKPFALLPQECDMMTRKAAEKDKMLAVGYVVRCFPEYRFLYDTARSGRLGKLKLLRLTRETGMPSWGSWSDPEFFRASGGALFDMMSHDVDFARFCMGEPEKITSVPGLSGDFNGNLHYMLLEFNGAKAIIDGGFVMPSAYPFNCRYSAFFENGTIRWEIGKSVEEIAADGTVSTPDIPAVNPYAEELNAFINAVAGKGSMVCTGEDAAKTIALCKTVEEQLNGER